MEGTCAYMCRVCMCVYACVCVRLPEFKAEMRLHTSTAFLLARCRVDSRVMVLSRKTGTCHARAPSTGVFLETNESHVTGKDDRKARRNGAATLVAKRPILRDGKRPRRNAVLQSAASPSSPVVEFPSLISGSSSSSPPGPLPPSSSPPSPFPGSIAREACVTVGVQGSTPHT